MNEEGVETSESRCVKSAKGIRTAAWNALGGQYLPYVAAYLLLVLVLTMVAVPLLALLGAGVAISGIGPYFAPGGHPEIGLLFDPEVMLPFLASVLLFSVAIIYPIGFGAWGQAAMAMAAMRRGLTVGHAFSGWGHGWKMGWIMLVKLTYLQLWYMLLLVPGIVKTLSYAMTEFVAVDHPDWSANQCISESRRLMDGHKWRYLLMLASFAGWFVAVFLASMLPVVGGIAQWLFMPYFETAKAAFYEDLLDGDAVV